MELERKALNRFYEEQGEKEEKENKKPRGKSSLTSCENHTFVPGKELKCFPAIFDSC